jgi:hypothetical protein
LIEGTPLGVCQQCSERFLTADDAAQIDKLIRSGSQPKRFEQVPVLGFDG